MSEVKIVKIKNWIAEPDSWVWMPHAAHFVASEQCRFRMATVVNDFIISTVGDYFPYGENFRKEIGRNRFFETMVFLSKDNDNDSDYCDCCFKLTSGDELEMEPYNDSVSAVKGHINMCNTYSRMRAVKNG